MLGSMLLLVALSCTLQEGESPGPEECRTCAGVGDLVDRCWTCDGSGIDLCVQCSPPKFGLDSDRFAFIVGRLDPLRAEIQVRSQKLREDLSKILGGGSLRMGSILCPARCRDGKSLGNQGRKCLPCAGRGSFSCPSCKGQGTGPCHTCGGKKEVLSPCPECNGARSSLPPPPRTSASVDTCPWCEGRELLTCEACPDGGLRDQICPQCAGSGRSACGTCKGTERAPCHKCSSTGDLSSFYGLRSSGRCDRCKTKGFLPCACKGKPGRCEPCEGVGHVKLPCQACVNEKVAPCMGCWRGSGRAWAVTGERLLDAGETAIGKAYLEAAIAREKAAKKQALDSFEGTPHALRALKTRYDRRIKAVVSRFSKAR